MNSHILIQLKIFHELHDNSIFDELCNYVLKHCLFDNPLKKSIKQNFDWLCIFCNQILLLSILDLIWSHYSITTFYLKKSLTNWIVE